MGVHVFVHINEFPSPIYSSPRFLLQNGRDPSAHCGLNALSDRVFDTEIDRYTPLGLAMHGMKHSRLKEKPFPKTRTQHMDATCKERRPLSNTFSACISKHGSQQMMLSQWHYLFKATNRHAHLKKNRFDFFERTGVLSLLMCTSADISIQNINWRMLKTRHAFCSPLSLWQWIGGHDRQCTRQAVHTTVAGSAAARTWDPPVWWPVIACQKNGPILAVWWELHKLERESEEILQDRSIDSRYSARRCQTNTTLTFDLALDGGVVYDFTDCDAAQHVADAASVPACTRRSVRHRHGQLARQVRALAEQRRLRNRTPWCAWPMLRNKTVVEERPAQFKRWQVRCCAKSPEFVQGEKNEKQAQSYFLFVSRHFLHCPCRNFTRGSTLSRKQSQPQNSNCSSTFRSGASFFAIQVKTALMCHSNVYLNGHV